MARLKVRFIPANLDVELGLPTKQGFDEIGLGWSDSRVADKESQGMRNAQRVSPMQAT
jgi:hypothetical protein